MFNFLRNSQSLMLKTKKPSTCFKIEKNKKTEEHFLNLAAPYWHDQPPPNVNTSEGETVTFDCKSSGNPTPTVTFYKNGVGQ